MLVLSRGVGQRIVIRGDIVVEVVQAGGTVRLGVTAPPDVRIDREEIHRQRIAEQRTPR